MKRTFGALLVALALLTALAGPSAADSQTKSGEGDLTKMWVNNGKSAVTVKLFAPGGKCKVANLMVTVTGADNLFYAYGACPSPGTWKSGLQNKNLAKVACSGFKLTYNKDNKFWRVYVPRTCLKNLGNKIKVSAYVQVSGVPGAAGPTKWLGRG